MAHLGGGHGFTPVRATRLCVPRSRASVQEHRRDKPWWRSGYNHKKTQEQGEQVGEQDDQVGFESDIIRIIVLFCNKLF